MSIREIEAGRAFIRIALKESLGKELDAVTGKLRSWGRNLAGLGAIIGGTAAATGGLLFAAAKMFADAGSEIADAMQRTGLSAKELQVLKYAAEQAGASFDDVQAAARKMNNSIADAANAGSTAREALHKIGLTFEDLKKMNPDERIQAIVKGLASINDPAARGRLTMELLGKAGVALSGAIADYTEQRARLESLGAIISDDDVALADEFGDSLHDVYIQSYRIVYGIGAAVATAIKPFLATVKQALRATIEWVDGHRKLISAVTIATAVVIGLGGALLAAGIAVGGTGIILNQLLGLLSKIASVTGIFTGAIRLGAGGIGILGSVARGAFSVLGVGLSGFVGIARMAWSTLQLLQVPLAAVRPLAAGLGIAFRGVSAVLSVLPGGLIGIVRGFAGLGGVVAHVADSLLLTGLDVLALVGRVTLLGPIVGVLTSGLTGLGTILGVVLGGPLASIIIGVGAAVGAFYLLRAALSYLGGNLGTIGAFVRDLASGAFGFLGSMLDYASLALTKIGGLFSWVGGVARSAGSYVSYYFGVRLPKDLAAAQEMFTSFVAQAKVVLAQLKDTAMETFGGISDALAAGDIQLAAEILWAGLKLAWIQGTKDLRETWAAWKAAIITTAVDAFYGVQIAWANVKAQLLSAWSEVSAKFGSIWDATMGVITDAFSYALLEIRKGINDVKGWWDDSFDSDGANKKLQAEYDDGVAARRKREVDREGKRENTLPGDLAKIESERAALVKQLDALKNAKDKSTDANAAKDIDGLTAELKQRKAELDTLRADAAKKREAAGKPEEKKKREGDAGDLDKQRKEADIGPIGTFNASFAQMFLGGQSTADYQRRTAAAAEETAKNTRRGLKWGT